MIDTLVVFNLDRIGRRTDLLPFITKLTLAQVTILSVTEGVVNNGTDVDELMTFIKLWSSQGESKKTSARVRSGKLKTALDGKWNGGKINLGYKVENQRLIVDTTIAPIIREAFHIYINEGTIQTIEFLKQHNIEKNQQTLTQMLRNPIYMGVYNYNKELYSEDDYEKMQEVNPNLQIVSQEVWYRAREVASMRKKNKDVRCLPLNRSECEYEGILVHHCGNSLTCDYDTRGTEPKLIFKCRHCKKYKIDTYKKTYVAHRLIPTLDAEIKKLFFDLDEKKLKSIYLASKGEKVVNRLNTLKEIDSTLKIKHRALEGAKKKLEVLLSNDVDMETIQIVTDSIKEIKSSITELEIQRDNIALEVNSQQEKDKRASSIIDKFLSLKDVYEIADYKQKRQILFLIISEIVVRDYDDIDIRLNF